MVVEMIATVTLLYCYYALQLHLSLLWLEVSKRRKERIETYHQTLRNLINAS